MSGDTRPVLADLNGMRRWTAWQTQERPGRKPTKIPYGVGGAEAQSNNPSTWLALGEAVAMAAALPKPLGAGGVGIFLGDLGEGVGDGGWSLGGIDYNSCIGPEGMADWAAEGLAITGSYAEMSPSGNGVKQFFLYRTENGEALRSALRIKPDGTGRKWSMKGAGRGDHPPGIEVYLSRRYFAVTLDRLGAWNDLGVLGTGTVLRLMLEIVPRLTGKAAAAAAAAAAGRRRRRRRRKRPVEIPVEIPVGVPVGVPVEIPVGVPVGAAGAVAKRSPGCWPPVRRWSGCGAAIRRISGPTSRARQSDFTWRCG